MYNKKFPVLFIILALFCSLLLSSCSFMDGLKSSNKENTITFAAEGFGKSPQDIFMYAWKTIKDQYVDKTCNDQDWSRWRKKYLDQIKTREDAYVAIETMIESLNDPYTRFLPPYEFAEQNRNIDAELYGIGVHIAKVKDKVVIIHIIDGTPAKEAGLKTGDIILKVNNDTTKGMDLKEIANRVRGKIGTSVTLKILRDKKEIVKEITRKKINLKSVEYKVLKGNYAYIKISSFISSETSFEMLKALSSTKDTKGIILDLRGNHGGLLPNAIFISNMFVDKGDIVSIVDRYGHKKTIKAEEGIKITDKPLVVLINQASASASEILSGALKDHKRAILVGETTFGKGFVQKIQRLPDGSGINITIAKYLTPKGTDIDQKGIHPDYVIELTREDFLKDRDPQLEKARQLIVSQSNKQLKVSKK